MKLTSILPLSLALVATAAAAQPVFTFPKSWPQPQASVTVAWDSMAGATNYILYNGDKSRAYTNWIATTNQTTFTIPVTRGSTNYIAVTQMQRGLESDFSSELVYIAPAGPPPPTNLVKIAVVVQSSTNMLQWINVATLPALTYTNPAEPLVTYRALMNINQTPLQ